MDEFQKDKSHSISLGMDDPLIRTFFAEVIHKIKNKLGGIGGFVTLIERDMGTDPANARLFQKIQDGILQLNDFLIALMKLFQEHEWTPTEFDLVQLIRSTWNDFEGTEAFVPKLQNTQLELGRFPIYIFSDAGQWREMVQQLLLFAGTVMTELTGLFLRPDDAHTIQIQLIGKGNLPKEESLRKDISLWMTCSYFPIEARLALLLATVYGHRLGVQMNGVINESQTWELNVAFQKGRGHE